MSGINRAEMLILVDSGTSHNFVSPQVVYSLDLKVDYSKKLVVKLGDGHRVFTVGKWSKVPVIIGDFSILIEAFVLE